MTNFHNTKDRYYKHKTREETIVKAYRRIFNKKSIPNDTQYWTLGADCTVDWSELRQVVECNLIKMNQFYSVDCDEYIIEKNQSNYPKATWIQNDIIDEIVKRSGSNSFNPKIINYDCTSGPKEALCGFDSIYKSVNKGVMIVVNFIIKHPCYSELRYSEDDVIEMCRKVLSPFMRNSTYFYNDDLYTYETEERTKMGGFICVK